MAQISSNWTAPTFSFDVADHPTAWRDFYYRAQDYLELLRIKPTEEDQLKRGWEQITTMFTGENRQILQTLIDNNKITETDQQTPLLALKAIQSAIKNKEHHKTSTTTATKSATTTTKSSTKCPWRQFYKRIIKYMDSLNAEPCKSQMKIDTFIHAIKHSFPSPTTDPEKHETSTKQTQTIEQPKMAQDPSNNTKKTANSETDDTDSAYNTEAESSYAAHLPRPSKATHVNQQHPDPTTVVKPPQKSTLLPTPPAPARNHHNQHISGPSASRHNTYSAFSRPSTFSSRKQHISRPSEFNNYRFNQRPPLLPRPSCQHQNFMTGPYQQTQGHLFTRPYQQHQQPQGHCTQQVFHIHISLPYPPQYCTA